MPVNIRKGREPGNEAIGLAVMGITKEEGT